MPGLVELNNLVKLNKTTRHITIAPAISQGLSLSSTKHWSQILGSTRVHAFHLPDRDKETELHILYLIDVVTGMGGNQMNFLWYPDNISN